MRLYSTGTCTRTGIAFKLKTIAKLRVASLAIVFSSRTITWADTGIVLPTLKSFIRRIVSNYKPNCQFCYSNNCASPDLCIRGPFWATKRDIFDLCFEVRTKRADETVPSESCKLPIEVGSPYKRLSVAGLGSSNRSDLHT